MLFYATKTLLEHGEMWQWTLYKYRSGVVLVEKLIKMLLIVSSESEIDGLLERK